MQRLHYKPGWVKPREIKKVNEKKKKEKRRAKRLNMDLFPS